MTTFLLALALAGPLQPRLDSLRLRLEPGNTATVWVDNLSPDTVPLQCSLIGDTLGALRVAWLPLAMPYTPAAVTVQATRRSQAPERCLVEVRGAGQVVNIRVIAEPTAAAVLERHPGAPERLGHWFDILGRPVTSARPPRAQYFQVP